jgi:hypothetical protein
MMTKTATPAQLFAARVSLDPDFSPFEPLLISYLDQGWDHHDAEKYADDVHPVGVPYTLDISPEAIERYQKYQGRPLHRIEIKFADGTTCYLVATSAMIDEYWMKPSKPKLAAINSTVHSCLAEDPEFGEGLRLRQAFSKGKWTLNISPDEIGTIIQGKDGLDFEHRPYMAYHMIMIDAYYFGGFGTRASKRLHRTAEKIFESIDGAMWSGEDNCMINGEQCLGYYVPMDRVRDCRKALREAGFRLRPAPISKKEMAEFHAAHAFNAAQAARGKKDNKTTH